MSIPSTSFSVDRKLRLLLCALIAFELSLAIIYFIGVNTGTPGIQLLFDLDQEANLPSWFSSSQLLAIAAVLGFYAVKPLERVGVPNWLTLLAAGVFLFLSMDEIAQVHERVARDLRSISWLPRVRQERGIWVFVYLAAALPPFALALRHLPALWRAHPTAVRFLFAGIASLGAGAVGVELIADQFVRDGAASRAVYEMTVLVEETLEMLGGTFLLLGVARIAFVKERSKWHETTPLVRAAETEVPV